MNLLYSKNIFSFRKYGNLSRNVFFSSEFAWPVHAWECYANKIESSSLDALSFTVLALLKLRTLSKKHIAKDLGISDELVDIVIKSLVKREFYDTDKKTVKQKGLNYLNEQNDDSVSSQKVFGYVFQSMVDGEIFPFFYEGKLPDPYFAQDEILFLDTEKQPDKNEATNDLQRKVNRAYHKYGIIYRKTEFEQPEKKITDGFFVDDDELLDLSYDEIPQEPETMHTEVFPNSEQDEKDKHDSLRNARIKVLNTKGVKLFVKCRFSVLKDDPEHFIVDSPFPNTETKWYSETFFRMANNGNVLFGALEENKKNSLKSYCADITNQMFVKIPELKELKPEEYIARNYPEVIKCSLKDKLIKLYMRIVRSEIHANHGEDVSSTIVIDCAKTVEFMLNNYIARTDRNKTRNIYYRSVSDAYDIEAVQQSLSVDNCSAVYAEKENWSRAKGVTDYFKRNSILRNFKDYPDANTMGISIMEKYYYLMIYANQNIASKIADLFKKHKELVPAFDGISKVRNKFGGHNDGTEVASVPKSEMETFMANFNTVSKILVANFD